MAHRQPPKKDPLTSSGKASFTPEFKRIFLPRFVTNALTNARTFAPEKMTPNADAGNKESWKEGCFCGPLANAGAAANCSAASGAPGPDAHLEHLPGQGGLCLPHLHSSHHLPPVPPLNTVPELLG